jgi:arylsulfatase A-like enzyme
VSADRFPSGGSLTRRQFLKTTGAMAIGVTAGCRLRQPSDPESARLSPPNILFILTDQQRFDALSCAGNPVVHTPNLDRLAAGGARFTQATCSSPLCGPSRAALLTGMHLHGHGFPRNAGIAQPGISESFVTRDELFARAGYLTGYQGKWHTGNTHLGCYAGGLRHYMDEYHEHLQARYGPLTPADGELVDRYTGWTYRPLPVDQMMRRAREDGFHMPHHPEAGVYPFRPEDSLTAWTVDRTIAFLEEMPAGPFNVTCSILHPHAPLCVTERYFRLYDPAKMPMPENIEDDFDYPRPEPVPTALPLTDDGLGMYISLYYGLVREVDDHVGRLLDALERTGQADNTVVVFTSDHGEMLGSHGNLSKSVFFEEAFRVPLLIRWPARIRAGTVIEEPATGADLAPTLLDLAGIEVPGHLHGRSLRAALLGESSHAPEFAYGSLGEGEYLSRSFRSTETKLVLGRGRPQLYDLSSDPGETRNLLDSRRRKAEHVDRAHEVFDSLLGYLEDTQDPGLDTLQSAEL